MKAPESIPNYSEYLAWHAAALQRGMLSDASSTETFTRQELFAMALKSVRGAVRALEKYPVTIIDEHGEHHTGRVV